MENFRRIRRKGEEKAASVALAINGRGLVMSKKKIVILTAVYIAALTILILKFSNGLAYDSVQGYQLVDDNEYETVIRLHSDDPDELLILSYNRYTDNLYLTTSSGLFTETKKLNEVLENDDD